MIKGQSRNYILPMIVLIAIVAILTVFLMSPWASKAGYEDVDYSCRLKLTDGGLKADDGAPGVLAIGPSGEKVKLEYSNGAYQIPAYWVAGDYEFKVIGCMKTYTASDLGLE